MNKSRIEAFSDGVIAIIITIMVLELHMPKVHTWADFVPLYPIIVSYALSFIIVGTYWINHHHMFHHVQHVGGWVLWANLHLLFWLSLMPFFTGVIGEDDFSGFTVMFYAFELMMCALAYSVLVQALRSEHGKDSAFDRALGSDRKGKLSLAVYVLALPLSYFYPLAALAMIAIVAVAWIVPDRRFVPKAQKA